MKKWKAMLLSAGIMIVVSIIVLGLAAVVLGKMKVLPRNAVPIITTISGCAAVFLGGFAASVYAKEKGVLLGAASGLLFSFCIALISVLIFKNDFSLASVGKLAAVLLSGSIGGILGVNRKSKVKF